MRPLENKGEQFLSYIFPGTQFDLTDSLPKFEKSNQYSAMVGGSLGHLAYLSPGEKTIQCITDA
ncbi:MAG: hypothetical protein ACD_51C00039G0001, partial [uncultured bacterium]